MIHYICVAIILIACLVCLIKVCTWHEKRETKKVMKNMEILFDKLHEQTEGLVKKAKEMDILRNPSRRDNEV